MLKKSWRGEKLGRTHRETHRHIDTGEREGERDKGSAEGGRERGQALKRSQRESERAEGEAREAAEDTSRQKQTREKEGVGGECGGTRPLGTSSKPKGQVFSNSSEGPRAL